MLAVRAVLRVNVTSVPAVELGQVNVGVVEKVVVTPAAAVVVPPAAAVVPAQTAPRSSGVFGASSGVGGDTTVGAAESKSPIQVPANATPAEIMALYNESLRREGKNPNDEFMRQFASKAR